MFGVDAVGLCIALTTICFSGALSAGLGLATTVFLLATFLMTLVLLVRGGFSISLALTQDTTIVILAPAVATAAALVTGPEAAHIGTAFAVIGCPALLWRMTFWLVGRFRLGYLIRMFPFPVAAGFLASSGYLLIFSAVSIVVSRGGAVGGGGAEELLRLVPLLAMTARFFDAKVLLGGSSGVILVVGVGIILFHGWLWTTGLTAADAVSRHWLPDVPKGGVEVGFDLLWLIDGVAVVLVNMIVILLNTAVVLARCWARWPI